MNDVKFNAYTSGQILDDKGKDPYLEDIGTLWLLHYNLISNDFASIYSYIFNDLLKSKQVFTKSNLLDSLIHKCEVNKCNTSISTLKKDITVFLHNYIRPIYKNIEHEIDLEGVLCDLELIKISDFDAVKSISEEVEKLFNMADLFYKNIHDWGRQLYYEPPHEGSILKMLK